MNRAPTIEAGIAIPAELAGNLAGVDEIVPNTWNPNRMEGYMRDKLARGMKTDGFLVPIIVRPLSASQRPDKADLIARGVVWEIVDGEHRYHQGCELGMSRVPYISAGAIDDAVAKQITVKANGIRGEFDSVKLAEMVAELAASVGMDALKDDLPYTPERLQAMVDLISIDTTALAMPGLTADGDGATAAKPADAGFSSFDGAGMSFDHKCPRCAFEFNTPKDEPPAGGAA